MVNDIITELTASMDGAIDALKRELTKRRTGRANVALLDGIKVDYYGTPSPLNQVAAIQIPEPRLIIVKPWEKNMVQPIERAIQLSPLSFNPSSDGEQIRIPIPALTTERRKALIKDVKRVGEEAKVGLRNQRRDSNEMIKVLEKDKSISEDEMHRGLARVQEVTDDYVKRVDVLLVAKEKEVLED